MTYPYLVLQPGKNVLVSHYERGRWQESLFYRYGERQSTGEKIMEWHGMRRFKQQVSEQECLEVLKKEKRGVLALSISITMKRMARCIFTAPGKGTKSIF